MGAYDFTNVVMLPDVDVAFQAAKQSAQHEYGHGGYTGTIAEKDGWVVIDGSGLSRAAAEELAGTLLQGDERVDDKWGPAGAIKVVDRDQTGWLFCGWASS